MVLTDRFTPEVSAASTRIHAHARIWREMGHDVTVVTCAPNFPRGRLFPGYSNRLLARDEVDGIEVLRLWSYMAPNEGTIRRSMDYVSYAMSVALQSARLPDPDIILASSPPITVAIAGHVLARVKRVPWVFEVRDLWPASIRAVGVTQKNALLSVIEKMELSLYRSAARVIVLTAPFKKDIAGRGIPPERIDVVTNGIDAEAWLPTRDRRATRDRLGVPADAFLVGFVGTLGLSQGATVLVRAAVRLHDDPRIHFLIVGEGAGRGELAESIARERIGNVTLHDFVPHAEVPNVLAALDVATIVLKDDPVFRTVLPSKIFEVMAARLPIVAAVAGEAARVISESGAGICVSPEDGDALARAVLDVRGNPERAGEMARLGGEYVKRNYSRGALALAALNVLQRSARNGGRRTTGE